ncbi:nuclear transport factor 2 family protein, partial [Nonomuraea longicatena]
ANSTLQRARAALPATPGPRQAVDEDLLDRYIAAFESFDVETLVALLHEDATTSMPPFGWWLRGRADISRVLTASGNPCAGSRLVKTSANGLPALAQYRNGEAFAITVMAAADGRIREETVFLDPLLFPLFGLPMSLAGPGRT